jgi:hypothetical protein
VRIAREEFALGAACGFGGATGFDAVVHGLAQRAVCLCQALGSLDHLRFEVFMLFAELLLAVLDLAEHHVETAHQVADLIIGGHLRPARIIAALGGLHGVDQVEQRRRDLPLHAPRK